MATQTKHTPGPWKTDSIYVVAEVSGGRPGGEVIIRCGRTVPGAGNKQEDEANAALTAAAPDLLEALREIIVLSEPGPWPDPVGDVIEATAKAAIAKAEGR